MIKANKMRNIFLFLLVCILVSNATFVSAITFTRTIDTKTIIVPVNDSFVQKIFVPEEEKEIPEIKVVDGIEIEKNIIEETTLEVQEKDGLSEMITIAEKDDTIHEFSITVGPLGYVISDNEIIIIDASTDNVIRRLNLEDYDLRYLALDKEGTMLYVLAEIEKTGPSGMYDELHLLSIDTSTNKIVSTMTIGVFEVGRGMYVDDKGYVFVLHDEDYFGGQQVLDVINPFAKEILWRYEPYNTHLSEDQFGEYPNTDFKFIPAKGSSIFMIDWYNNDIRRKYIKVDDAYPSISSAELSKSGNFMHMGFSNKKMIVRWDTSKDELQGWHTDYTTKYLTYSKDQYSIFVAGTKSDGTNLITKYETLLGTPGDFEDFELGDNANYYAHEKTVSLSNMIPYYMKLSPDGEKLYVMTTYNYYNGPTNNILVYDTENLELEDIIDVQADRFGPIVFTPDKITFTYNISTDYKDNEDKIIYMDIPQFNDQQTIPVPKNVYDMSAYMDFGDDNGSNDNPYNISAGNLSSVLINASKKNPAAIISDETDASKEKEAGFLNGETNQHQYEITNEEELKIQDQMNSSQNHSVDFREEIPQPEVVIDPEPPKNLISIIMDIFRKIFR